jgi:hypothetical protein
MRTRDSRAIPPVFPALTDCSYRIAGNYSGGSEHFVARIMKKFVEKIESFTMMDKIIPECVVDKRVAQ